MIRPALLIAIAIFAARLCMFGAETPLPPDLLELQRRIEATPKSERAPLLTDFADRLEAVDPLRGIPAAREAIALARSPREQLAAEAVLTGLLRYQTDYAAAIEAGQSALQRATALGDERLRARLHYELGRIQWNLAEHAEALKHFHEAIRLAERVGDARVLAGAHLGAHIIWEEFEEQDHALAHIEAAKKYSEQVGDAQRLADYQRSLGNYLIGTKDLAGARAAHERSRAISERAGQLRGVADGWVNLSFIAELENQLDAAIPLAQQAIAIYEQLQLKRYLANAYRQYGRELAKQQRHAEALDYLQRSLALAEAFGGRAAIANTYRQLAFAYAAVGDLAMARECQGKVDAATDAIFGEKSRQKIALLDAQFNFERSEHRLALLQRDQAVKEAELQLAHAYRYALIAIIAVMAVAAAAIVSRQRLKLAAERRVLEETRAAHGAAEEANRFKTRLLGIASHDLRSPLAAMIAGAREIEQAPHDTALVTSLSGGLQREGERLLTLVGDLLDLSALESKRLVLARTPCDLAALVLERVLAQRPAAAAKDQTLTCKAPTDGSVLISADAARLAQVFDNLIGNAVKFTPRGQTITVSVEGVGGKAIARIHDTGPGLRPDDMTRAFQPFQTLSAQPTGGESSSGLGLFIARELVSLHGGHLGVDSRPGEGATFFVELALAADASR